MVATILTVRAQAGSVSDAPSFPIVDIVVVGTRWSSRDLVESELRLERGKSYTESDLGAARRRLHRLPFILDADFSLQKGPSYGTYVLVVRVRESKPFLLHYVRGHVRSSETMEMSGVSSSPRTSHGSSVGQDLAVGARVFFSGYGFGYVVADRASRSRGGDVTPYYTLDTGINYYNLFGKGVFLNLDVRFTAGQKLSLYDEQSASEFAVRSKQHPSPSVAVSVPLSVNQWLSVDAYYSASTQNYDFDALGQPFVDRVRDRRLQLGMTWTFDSTDDLLVPTAGTRAESGLSHISLVSTQRSTRRSDRLSDALGATSAARDSSEREFTGKATQVFASFVVFVPVREQLSVKLGALGSVRLSDAGDLIGDPGFRRFALDAAASWDLWGPGLTSRFGDLRLEAGLQAFGQAHRYQRSTGWQIEMGIVYRSEWAYLRFSYRHVRTSTTVESSRSFE
ncbi:MAG: hypothetical protein HYX75_03725 [Acidobacteria bacterium]|nr:hypothetical protein [Acidobacteriota bacterium]